MIITRQKHVPWMWIVLLTATSGVAALVDTVSGSALTFTMRKFTSDPALITFLGSINIAFNFLVAPYASWKSDRIWTRWGRRKPFMLAGMSILVLALIAAPFAPSLWALTVTIILYQFAMDLGYTGPWSPLLYETVPLHQRGRMSVIKHIMGVGVRLLYNWVLIRQFDSIYHLKLGMGVLTITGEQALYFTTAGLVVAALLHLALNVREVKPDPLPAPERFSPRKYLHDVFSERQFVMLYVLLFCLVAIYAGLGQLGPLLITEQFGYTKSVMGKIATVSVLVDLCVAMPLAAFLADRFDRFRTFQVGLFLSTVHPLLWWCFIKYMAPGQIPTPLQIVVAGSSISALHAAASVCLEPYFFDLVPRNKMGALNSGFLFVRGIMSMIVANGVGLWVKYYSKWFAPPGKVDYTSGYLYVVLIGLLGCVVSVYFSIQRRKGNIIEYGRMDEGEIPSTPTANA